MGDIEGAVIGIDSISVEMLKQVQHDDNALVLLMVGAKEY